MRSKFLWLKMWNEFIVPQEAQNFPKFRFSNSEFDKWLHKATVATLTLGLQLSEVQGPMRPRECV
jgi:hypothetical protein